jgi:hypothetical protein
MSRVTTSLRKLLTINVEAHATMCTCTVCKSGSTTDVCRSLSARATGENSRVVLSQNKTEPVIRDDLLRYARLNRKEPLLTWRENLTLRKLHVDPPCSSTCAQSGCLTIRRALPFAFASSCRSPKLRCIARLHRSLILVGALFLQFNTKLSSSFSPASDKQP